MGEGKREREKETAPEQRAEESRDEEPQCGGK